MAYIREHWEDSPSTETAINARRLNHIEGGIEDNDQRITVLEANPIGHVVLDKLGTASTQRDRIQFTGVAEVSDNAPSNKTIVNIPSSLSDYTNDAGFIDITVNNLLNYYKKTETYTQAEVNALISAIVTLNILVVQTLPTQDISTTTIYLVPKASAETQDVYDEYIYVNNAWEHIGSTQVDLTNYYTKTETDALLADKVDKVAGKQLSTEDFTSALKSKLEGIEAGAQANVQADWNQTDNTADDYIKNKPTIPDAQIQSDWNQTDTSAKDYIKNKPTIPSGGDSVSWNQIQQTGQKIAEIDINGTTQDVYAPQGGGGSYSAGDGIDITNNEISVDTTFTEASTRTNIASGDSLSTIWGKIKKWFSDLASMFVAKTGDTMSGNLTIDKADGTTSTVGSSVLVVGNNTASGTAGNSRGTVYIYGASAYYSRIRAGALTAHREVTLPDKGGTFAMTSDIPTDFVSKESGGTFSGNVTVNRANGTTSSVGISYLVLGNSTASGTANNSKGVLWIYGKGSNYATISATDITSNRGFELPNKGGTIALTSNIPSTTSSSTTHGTLYKYGNVRVWQSVESATSITIPNTYTWSSEIASGDRPSYSANIHGCTLDSNGNVTGDISGALGTNGTMTFRTSNGSTGNYYLRMNCMWIVG